MTTIFNLERSEEISKTLPFRNKINAVVFSWLIQPLLFSSCFGLFQLTIFSINYDSVLFWLILNIYWNFSVIFLIISNFFRPLDRLICIDDRSFFMVLLLFKLQKLHFNFHFVAYFSSKIYHSVDDRKKNVFF